MNKQQTKSPYQSLSFECSHTTVTNFEVRTTPYHCTKTCNTQQGFILTELKVTTTLNDPRDIFSDSEKVVLRESLFTK